MCKTPLLKQPKTSMDLTIESCLHGIKITAEQGLSMDLPEISNITKATLHSCASHHIDQKIHGKHPCKDGMA